MEYQVARLAEVHRLQVRSRVQHLLHTGAPFRPFVTDHHHVAGFHLTAQNTVAGLFLRFEYFGSSLEAENVFVHFGRFDDTAVLGDITEKYGQSTVFDISVFEIANTPFRTVGIELVVIVFLRAHHEVEPVARCAFPKPFRFGGTCSVSYRILFDGFG